MPTSNEIRESFQQTLLLGFLQRQCDFCIFAHGQLYCLQKSKKNVETYFFVQSFLSAHTNISKTLARGALRSALSVGPTAFKNRNLRNAFDHMDERIISATDEKQEPGVFGLYNLRDGPGPTITGPSSLKYFMEYDRRSMTLEFDGHTMSLQHEIVLINALKKRVLDLQAKSSPFPPLGDMLLNM